MGQITVNLPKEIEFRKLTLKFIGQSFCYWSTGDKYSHSNTKNYFSEKTVLLNTLPPADGIKLGPGQFTYPFASFGLPLHIPASFEAPFGIGWVRYVIEIKFDTEKLLKLKSDIKQQIGFKVHIYILLYCRYLRQSKHLLALFICQSCRFFKTSTNIVGGVLTVLRGCTKSNTIITGGQG